VSSLIAIKRWRPVHQRVCEEQPYNVVTLGPGSEHVLSILEGARVQFNVEVFRDDYETLRDYLKIHPRPSMRSQGRNYRKLRDFVSSYRRVYKQTDAIPVETVDEWVQWGDQPHQGGYKPEPLPRELWIRSRFFRSLNRRFHARNFWPERVHKEFRERWFSFPVHVPEQTHAEPGGGQHEPWEHSVIEAHVSPGHYVERDVVTSQIQTLAVFLGIEDLEALATSEHPTLKEWLADRLWKQHLETEGGLLARGYKPPQNGNDQLLAFAKAHLMRFYGGDLSKIIRKCGRDEGTYGPGWRTSRGLWAKPTIKPGTKTVVLAKSGVGEAVERATEFFVKLPAWTDDLETFLVACRTLAERMDGVVFQDPLDGTEFRWTTLSAGRSGSDTMRSRSVRQGRILSVASSRCLPEASTKPRWRASSRLALPTGWTPRSPASSLRNSDKRASRTSSRYMTPGFCLTRCPSPMTRRRCSTDGRPWDTLSAQRANPGC